MLSYSAVKLLSLLVSPLIQVLLLFVLGVCCYGLRRARVAATVLCGSLLWLWLCSTPYVAAYLMAGLEQSYPPIAVQNLPQADAIVLLGGAVRGSASRDTLADMSGVGDRVTYAVAAFRAGKATRILVTGGGPREEITEAQHTREILIALGVPADRIVMEPRNRVTMDNGLYTAARLEKMGVKSILLVTSAFHMARAMLVFKPMNLRVYPAATDYQVLRGGRALERSNLIPSVKALQRTTWAFHELAGQWYYRQ